MGSIRTTIVSVTYTCDICGRSDAVTSVDNATLPGISGWFSAFGPLIVTALDQQFTRHVIANPPQPNGSNDALVVCGKTCLITWLTNEVNTLP